MSELPHVHTTKCTGQAWDDFLAQCPEAGFFDSSPWLAAFSSEVDEIQQLKFMSAGEPVAGISLGLVHQRNQLRVLSPVAASFGGLVWRERPSLAMTMAVAESLAAHLNALTSQAMEVRYVQRPQAIDTRSLTQVEEFCLLRQGFTLLDARVEYYIVLQEYSPCSSHRRKLKLSNRELVFSAAEMNEFLSFRRRVISQQGKDTTVDDASMRTGYAAAQGGIRIYKATRGKATVAMLLEDRVTPTCAIGRNWFHDLNHLDIHPTVFLLDCWLRTLQAQGLQRASLGGCARLSLPFSPGIAFFKERFKPVAAMRKEFRYISPARSQHEQNS